MRLAEQTGDREEEAVVLNNLGLAYHESGDEPHAIERFEKALAIQHDLGNLANEGAAWSNLGAIHYTQGDLQSLDAFVRALALRRQGKDRRGEANPMGKIAVVRHAFGDDEEALRAFQTTLQIDREVGDHAEESTATMNTGSVYMAQARYAGAVACFGRAMRLQEQWGKSGGAHRPAPVRRRRPGAGRCTCRAARHGKPSRRIGEPHPPGRAPTGARHAGRRSAVRR